MRTTHVLFLSIALSIVGVGSSVRAQTIQGFSVGAVLPQADSTVQVSDQKAGSVLVFPFYGSDGSNANDSRLTITNVGPAGLPGGPVPMPMTGTTTEVLNNLNVHLFWMDSSCSQADGYVCFTKFQSWTFKASEWDPVTARGFLIAVAVDPQGYPISYNGLIGNAFVNCNVTQSGATERWLGNYGAEAFASLGVSLLPIPNPATVYFYTTAAKPNTPAAAATLLFNNGPRAGVAGYDAGANSFAAEFQSPVNSTGQTVLLVPLSGTVGGTLVGNGFSNNNTALLYRNDEKEYSWTGPAPACQMLIRISSTNPRILGGLGTQISSGKSGTLVWGTTGGSVGLFVSPAAGNQAFIGIRGLHKRSVSLNDPGLTMPVFVPTCII